MTNTVTKKSENISLSTKDYQALLEAYQKLGEILVMKKDKKPSSSLKSLYGIWEGVEVDEEDFEASEKSLFKTSL